MDSNEHVCTPGCDTFCVDVETCMRAPRVRAAVRTAFYGGFVLGVILSVVVLALFAVGVAVVR